MATRSLGRLTLDLVANTGMFTQGLNKAQLDAQKAAKALVKAQKEAEEAAKKTAAATEEAAKKAAAAVEKEAKAAQAAAEKAAKETAAAAEKHAKMLAARWDNAFKMAGTAAIGLIATVTAFTAKSLHDTIADAKEIQNMANLGNTDTETFQRWVYAADTVGVGMEKVGDVFKDVQDKVGEFIQTGAGPLKDFFEYIAPQVGVTAEQFKKLSGPDALQLYIDTLQKAGLSQQEMTFYMEALASDSSKLIPLLANNGKALNDLGDEAVRTGHVMSSDVISQTKLAQSAMRDIEGQVKQFEYALASQLLPRLLELAGAFSDTENKIYGTGDAIDSIESFVNILAGSFMILASVLYAVISGLDAFIKLGGIANPTAMAKSLLEHGDLSGYTADVKAFGDAMHEVNRAAGGVGDGVATVFAPVGVAAKKAREEFDRTKKAADEFARTAPGQIQGQPTGTLLEMVGNKDKPIVDPQKFVEQQKEIAKVREEATKLTREYQNQNRVIGEMTEETKVLNDLSPGGKLSTLVSTNPNEALRLVAAARAADQKKITDQARAETTEMGKQVALGGKKTKLAETEYELNQGIYKGLKETNPLLAQQLLDGARKIDQQKEEEEASKKAQAAGKKASDEAKRSAEQLQNQYDNLLSSHEERIALMGKEGELAKVIYAVTRGELSGLSEAQKEIAIASARRVEQAELNKNYQDRLTSIDKAIFLLHNEGEAGELAYEMQYGALKDLTEEQREELRLRQANKDAVEQEVKARKEQDEKVKREIEFAQEYTREMNLQIGLLGKTREEQERLTLAKDLGTQATTEYGKAAMAALEEYQRMRAIVEDQVAIADEVRSSFSGAIQDWINGTKSFKDAFLSALDSINKRILQMITDNWMGKLFGEQGTPLGGMLGGGQAGGWMNTLFSFFGRASGGAVGPNSLYEINESGMEMISISGRDYLLTGNQSGNVTPNHMLRGSSSMSQVNNFILQGRMDRRTQEQISIEVGRKATQAQNRNV